MADTTTPVMHPWFPFFPSDIVKGDPVQIDSGWLDQAATALMFRRPVGDTASLRILELNYEDDELDFHLSFKCEGGFAGQGHFCVRRKERGKNACLYWFYQVIRRKGGTLGWTWQGCAGKGDPELLSRFRPRGVHYGPLAQDCLTRLLRALAPPRGRLELHARRWTLWGPGRT
jgi:hypothetical protein